MYSNCLTLNYSSQISDVFSQWRSYLKIKANFGSRLVVGFRLTFARIPKYIIPVVADLVHGHCPKGNKGAALITAQRSREIMGLWWQHRVSQLPHEGGECCVPMHHRFSYGTVVIISVRYKG